jgi:hypothetical protein
MSLDILGDNDAHNFSVRYISLATNHLCFILRRIVIIKCFQNITGRLNLCYNGWPKVKIRILL